MPYQSLYRTWRPQVFADLVGQDHVRRVLMNALKAGRTAHAYLFAGPRGTGKTSTARILAKALNCPERQGPEPCDDCPACQRIARGEFLDVLEIDGASNRGIDEVRELRERIALAPAEGRVKIYIIDEVHMLTTEAFNALLKTLEDPPGHVTFILATTEPHRLPATILSRCQRFDFQRLSLEEMVERLRDILAEQGVDMEERTLYLLARRAEGSLRDSLALLEQCLSLGEEAVQHQDVLRFLGVAASETLEGILRSMQGGQPVAMLDQVNAFLDRGGDAREFIRQFTLFLRNLLMVRLAPEARELLMVSPEEHQVLQELAPGFAPQKLMDAIRYLGETEQEAKWAPQPRVLLEVLVLRLAQTLGQGEVITPTSGQPEASAAPADSAATASEWDDELHRPDTAEEETGEKSPPVPVGEETTSGSSPEDPENSGVSPLSGTGAPRAGEISGAGDENAAGSEAGEEAEARAGEDTSGPVPNGVAGARDPDSGPAAAPAGTGDFTAEPDLEMVQGLWGQVLDRVHQRAPLSRNVVDEAQPAALEGRRLTLVFSNPVWREKAEKNYAGEIREAINEVCGLEVEVHCTGEKPAGREKGPDGRELVQEVMELFGPELVQVVDESGEGGSRNGHEQDDETDAETAE